MIILLLANVLEPSIKPELVLVLCDIWKNLHDSNNHKVAWQGGVFNTDFSFGLKIVPMHAMEAYGEWGWSSNGKYVASNSCLCCYHMKSVFIFLHFFFKGFWREAFILNHHTCDLKWVINCTISFSIQSEGKWLYWMWKIILAGSKMRWQTILMWVICKIILVHTTLLHKRFCTMVRARTHVMWVLGWCLVTPHYVQCNLPYLNNWGSSDCLRRRKAFNPWIMLRFKFQSLPKMEIF